MKSYKILISLSLIFIVFISLNIKSSAKAKAHTVSTMDELTEYLYVNNHQESEVKLAKDFKIEGQALELYGYNKVTFDGQGNTFRETFEVGGEGYGDLHFKNMNFEDNGKPLEDVHFKIDIETKYRKVTLENFKFKNIKNIEYGVLKYFNLYGESNVELVVINSLFENNSSSLGGGIFIDNTLQPVTIKNSSFINNKVEANGGGAITVLHHSSDLFVENSVFSDNETDEGGYGGTIGIDLYGSEKNEINEISISNSYFSNNKFKKSKVYPERNAGSGAIDIFSEDVLFNLNIKGNTFSKNDGYNAGGAINVYDRTNGKSKINLESNTFFKNTAISAEHSYLDVGYMGGAVTLHSEGDHKPNKSNVNNSFKNNTLFMNSLQKRVINNLDVDVKGGGITISGQRGKHEFLNDLLVGNKTQGNKSPFKKYENIFAENQTLEVTDTLGFDNGVQSKETAEMVYGNYPIKLMENKGKIKAGVSSQRITIPTLPIAPKMNANLGVANMNVSNAPEFDQRGYKRVGKQDNGAIEISSILYDANKGNFRLNELQYYDGKTYYEGANPNQYAKVDVPSYQYTIIDGKKVLKPIRNGHTFLGWSTSKNSTSPNSKYKNGTKHVVTDQLKLYAVWSPKSSKTATIRYYNNGKTVGVVPIQKTVKSGSFISIFEKGKMKRKGYKFIGWSTKPNATKPNTNYKPGKVFKLTKNIKLYAVWKR